MKYFDAVWAYDENNQRFLYDCKLYVKDNSLYWLYTDKYCRDLTESEKNRIKGFKI